MDLYNKKAIIAKDGDKMPVKDKCEILDLPRSSYYYEGKKPNDTERCLKEVIKDLFENRPVKGHRMIWKDLLEINIKIGRDRTLKYMKEMGLKPIYPEKKTTIANKEHKKYPYLLRDLEITAPNQVWATDITYLKLPGGDCYFAGIIDWYSRRILSYRISNTMDKQFCIDALNEALALYGPPEIFNSDQGSQFTSNDFTAVLKENGIKISMDSVGRWADNIIIERFFRTLKYEDFYLRKYETIKETKEGIKDYLQYYNYARKHSSLGYATPDQVYCNDLLKLVA